MTPRRSILGTLAESSFLREPGKRRLLFLVLIAICALLALFPQKYRAVMSLTPSDPMTLGLGDTIRQVGAINSVFGNQAAVEVSLRVARSQYVRDGVSKRLNLPAKLGKSPIETDRWLQDEVEIRTLRGGILQFELKMRDAALAKQIVGTFGESVRQELSTISLRQTAYKKQILVELMQKSSDQLDVARSAYDTFRLRNRAALPDIAIRDIGATVPDLEGQIRAKQIQLSAMREFNTDKNVRVRQAQAEIAALQRQLAQARSLDTSGSPENRVSVGRGVRESTELDRLRRNLTLAQTLYDGYKKFLQGTTVEELTSTANVRVLEPAFIDSARQYNLIPASLGFLILILALAIEFYTLRPPLTKAVA
jgi:capsule polysaccharide export protein KpsE/RkpR